MALHRLRWEWINRHDDAVAPVREAFQQLQGMSWGKVAVNVIMADHRADDPVFIAGLLYLLDTRPCSVQTLQAILDIHGGHLYRFLDRAGIDWSAATGHISRELEDHGLSRVLRYYHAPLKGKTIVRGRVRAIPERADLWSSLDLVHDERPLTVPLPPRAASWVHAKKRRRVQISEPSVLPTGD